MARKTYHGFYKVRNPDKYIGDINDVVFRSLWERKLCVFNDNNPNVLKWGSEPIPIPYYSTVDKKSRRYFPDFIIKYKNKHGEVVTDVIEVKPYKETIPPKKGRGRNAKRNFLNDSITYQRNQDKWESAKLYAEKNNMGFRIMTEYELGIAKRKK